MVVYYHEAMKQNADLIASTVSNKSSSENHSPKFQAIKFAERENFCQFHIVPLSRLELKQVLQKSNKSAVEPDDVHCKLLTYVSECSLSLLLIVLTLFENPEYFRLLGEKPL